MPVFPFRSEPARHPRYARSKRRRAPLALALLLGPSLAPAPASAQEADALEELRNIGEFRPLRLEDAEPQHSAFQGQVTFSSGDVTGADGLLVRPEISVALPRELELGVGTELGRTEGQSAAGPVEGYLLGKFVEEGAFVPALALRGVVISPSPGVGLSGQVGLLSTKTFGRSRLNLSAAYRAQGDAGDRYVAGIGVDRALSDRLLVLGGIFGERLEDLEAFGLGAELGAAFRIDEHISVNGSVGLLRVGGDLDPQVRAGFIGR